MITFNLCVDLNVLQLIFCYKLQPNLAIFSWRAAFIGYSFRLCTLGWFRTCAEALQRYQQESLVEEEERRHKERKHCLKELQKEISDLNQADVGADAADFLKHIYATYPPKNSDWTLDLSLSPKKMLLKSILHYHPDKQPTDAYGVKWSVLCGEIIKIMTRRYERYKFEPTTSTTDENTKEMPEEDDEQATGQDHCDDEDKWN